MNDSIQLVAIILFAIATILSARVIVRWLAIRRGRKVWEGYLCSPPTVTGDHPLTAEEIRHLAQLGGNVAWDGHIDAGALYDRALSSEEILQSLHGELSIAPVVLFGKCDVCGKDFSQGSILYLAGDYHMKCADCVALNGGE